MWMMTQHGFYSVVANGAGTSVMVRARVRADLENLQALAPDLAAHVTIISTPHADYPFRIVIDKGRWASLAAWLASGVDYPNFKSRVAQDDLTRAAMYGRVWGLLRALDERGD